MYKYAAHCNDLQGLRGNVTQDNLPSTSSGNLKEENTFTFEFSHNFLGNHYKTLFDKFLKYYQSGLVACIAFGCLQVACQSCLVWHGHIGKMKQVTSRDSNPHSADQKHPILQSRSLGHNTPFSKCRWLFPYPWEISHGSKYNQAKRFSLKLTPQATIVEIDTASNNCFHFHWRIWTNYHLQNNCGFY